MNVLFERVINPGYARFDGFVMRSRKEYVGGDRLLFLKDVGPFCLAVWAWQPALPFRVSFIVQRWSLRWQVGPVVLTMRTTQGHD
jgi:hypothetical protein